MQNKIFLSKAKNNQKELSLEKVLHCDEVQY